MVELRIMHGGSKGTRTLQRGLFGFFRDLLREILWNRALGEKGVQNQLVSIYTSLPPGSRPVYPLDQTISQRWQDTCMDQETPNVSNKFMGCRKGNRSCGKTIGTLSEHAGV